MSHVGNVATFATGVYTVTRTAAGARTGGMVAQGTQTTFEVQGALLPASARILRLHKTGARAEDVCVLYVAQPLRVLEPECDVVTINGEAWRAFSCKAWDVPEHGAAFYEVLVSRIPQP